MVEADENQKKRAVSNDEYAQALAQPDNAAILSSFKKRFLAILGEDGFEDCALVGLWRALQYHRDDRGMKFTTSLYRFMEWECRKAAKKAARRRPVVYEGELDHLPSPMKEGALPVEIDHVLERMQRLPLADQYLIRSYYLEGKSAREIGLTLDPPRKRETVRKRISRGLNRLRRVVIAV